MELNTPQPTELCLDKARRLLVVDFEDGQSFQLSCHYLRTHSPSAEVRGHGHSEPMLLRGKENVTITHIEPVGNYAIQIRFDDGHHTGIYSWSFLYELGVNMEEYENRYAERLKNTP
jgi:DUF971 family protein